MMKLEFPVRAAVEIAIFSPVQGEVIPVPTKTAHGGVDGGALKIERPAHPFQITCFRSHSHRSIVISSGLDHGRERSIIIFRFREADGPVSMIKDRAFITGHRSTAAIIPDGPTAGHAIRRDPFIHVVGVIHKPGIINLEQLALLRTIDIGTVKEVGVRLLHVIPEPWGVSIDDLLDKLRIRDGIAEKMKHVAHHAVVETGSPGGVIVHS